MSDGMGCVSMGRIVNCVLDGLLSLKIYSDNSCSSRTISRMSRLFSISPVLCLEMESGDSAEPDSSCGGVTHAFVWVASQGSH